MGDESRFRYRLLDEGQARDTASAGARASAQDPRRPETRGRASRDYGRADAGAAYSAGAPAPDYEDDGYGRASTKESGAEDSLAELAKLIGDDDPFADFNDLDHGEGGPAQDHGADQPALDAPRAARFAAPIPARGQSTARTSAHEPAPTARATRAPLGSAQGQPAAGARGYDDAYEAEQDYRRGATGREEARYDDAGYDDAGYADAPYDDQRYDDQRYDDARYGDPRSEDSRRAGGARDYAPARAEDHAQDSGHDSAQDYSRDYAPAPRETRLPARLSASRDVAAPSAALATAPAARSVGAVRSGYGSLARQAAPPSPQPDDDAAYEARGYGQKGGDARAYDRDGYASDGYDDRGQADRDQADRGYADTGYDDDGYAPRGRDSGYDDRGYAGQGYDDRSYDDRGYDDRGYDDRGYKDDGRGGYGDEAAYAYADRRRGDAADDDYDAYDRAYDPEFADEGYMPPHGEEVYESEPRRRKGRMALLMAVSAIGLLVAGVAVFFAYRMAVGAPGLMSSGGTPPVIRADSSPAKIVTPAPPASEGQQKLIYDRVGGGANPNEHVVPREEQPVDVATASTGTTGATGGATEPKRVRTLTVRADGSIVQDGGASAESAAPAASAYAPGQNPVPTGLSSPTPASAGAAQTASANPPVSANGAYVVQVASQRSEADAMGSWRALQTRYPSLLGGYRASVKRADLGEKGIYYRAQVGPFASRDQANELCQSLRGQGGDCLVSKN